MLYFCTFLFYLLILRFFSTSEFVKLVG